MLHSLIAIWFGWVNKWGYLGIIVLMAMESSIFPVPSEVVIPPAAFYVAQGKMTFWGVVLAGTFGSYLGSAVTYLISRWVGRAFIARFGRYFFISEKKLDLAEKWIHRYEAGGIFFARLLPVIRHLISIPAGIVRMNFTTFSAMTIIGAFIWCWILAYLGQKAYQVEPGLIDDPEKMIHFIKHQSVWIIIGIVALMALYFLVLKLTGGKEGKVAANGSQNVQDTDTTLL